LTPEERAEIITAFDLIIQSGVDPVQRNQVGWLMNYAAQQNIGDLMNSPAGQEAFKDSMRSGIDWNNLPSWVRQ
jgi:hypothetical protein